MVFIVLTVLMVFMIFIVMVFIVFIIFIVMVFMVIIVMVKMKNFFLLNKKIKMVAVQNKKYTIKENKHIILTIKNIVNTLKTGDLLPVNNINDLTGFLKCELTKETARDGLKEVQKWENNIIQECEDIDEENRSAYIMIVRHLLTCKYNTECQKIIIEKTFSTIKALQEQVEYYKNGWAKEIESHNKTRELLNMKPETTIIDKPLKAVESSAKPKKGKNFSSEDIANIGNYCLNVDVSNVTEKKNEFPSRNI